MEDLTPSKKWFLDCPPLDLEREMLLGFDLSKRSSSNLLLLQNCDLPPPLNLFSPPDHDDPNHKAAAAAVFTPRQQDPKAPVPAVGKVDRREGDGGGEESVSLMRALRLSQTRAREAEEKAAEEKRRNQGLTSLMLEESLRLSAYRRWARLLEAEVSVLQRKGMKRQRQRQEEERGGDGSSAAAGTAAAWCFTLALCLGIAGVGFAVGRCIVL